MTPKKGEKRNSVAFGFVLSSKVNNELIVVYLTFSAFVTQQRKNRVFLSVLHIKSSSSC